MITLALLSNAGGTGKSTVAVNLAYSLAQKNVNRQPVSVALFDLDPPGTLNTFCGNLNRSGQESVARVLDLNFVGDYPFQSVWTEYGVKVDLCPSDLGTLLLTYDGLLSKKRWYYYLLDRFTDYPLPHDIVILDCPGSLGPGTALALAVATHILIPFQTEPKSIHAIGYLIDYYFQQIRELRLKPHPKILGLVPSQYQKDNATHRRILKDLPKALSSLGYDYPTYSPIRYSREFQKSSACGLPLFAYRPGHPATADFEPIVSDLLSLIRGKS
jgi:chromosome partitioning protein